MNAYDGGDIIYAATLTSALSGTYNAAMAAAIGLLGLRIVGTASEKGELEPLAKCRGDKKAVTEFIRQLKELWPQADILIYPARGLCSYYAERGGILLGAEFI